MEETEQQALTAFSHATEELRFFKSQQWHVTHYALLAYAALVLAPPEFSGWQLCAAFAAVPFQILVAIAAIVVLVALEGAIQKERNRLSDAQDSLPTIKRIHKAHRSEGTRTLLLLLSGVVVIGAIIAAGINVARLSSPSQWLSAAPSSPPR